MAEKTPLIVPPADARGSRCHHAQRCARARSAGKLIAVAAVAGLLYYGVPHGLLSPAYSSPAFRLHALLVGKRIAVDRAELCLTPACVHAASEILYNLSPDYKDLDPCDNFEELVCGGWRERHDLRADQGDAFTGTIMSENSQLLLRHILEAPYPKDSSVCVTRLEAVAR